MPAPCYWIADKMFQFRGANIGSIVVGNGANLARFVPVMRGRGRNELALNELGIRNCVLPSGIFHLRPAVPNFFHPSGSGGPQNLQSSFAPKLNKPNPENAR